MGTIFIRFIELQYHHRGEVQLNGRATNDIEIDTGKDYFKMPTRLLRSLSGFYQVFDVFHQERHV